ncbi:MAG: hypothetical protein KDD04_06090, partial [Sinomicrobium sp.]|nr:hypothetical protein [Sinomicrobium sp.]
EFQTLDYFAAERKLQKIGQAVERVRFCPVGKILFLLFALQENIVLRCWQRVICLTDRLITGR